MSICVTETIASYLSKKDKDLGLLISKYGLIHMELDDDLFVAIVYHIVEQMLSINVAKVIYNRVLEKCNGIMDSMHLLKLNRDDLRACGLSYAKSDFILEFANDYSVGKYDFNLLDDMTDSEVISYLRQINGVGKWTAEMLALFSLGRANIISYDDVALRNGIMKAKGYKTLSKKRFEILKKKYSPYCSYASLYFYRLTDDKEC